MTIESEASGTTIKLRRPLYDMTMTMMYTIRWCGTFFSLLLLSSFFSFPRFFKLWFKFFFFFFCESSFRKTVEESK